MYFLNYLHTYENVSKFIVANAKNIDEPLSFNNIARLYRKTVGSFREIPPKYQEGYEVSFEDSRLGVHIDKTGIFSEIFTGVVSTTEDERKKYTELTSKAYDLLRSLDERLYMMVSLLVTDVIYLRAKREGGGSASHLPGIVCISPGESWDEGDILESIMHEATHLNLFISDMVNGLFSCPLEALEKDNARVVSAVRVGQMRPLDKAFHSAAVAVPLMYLQNKQGKTSLVDMFTSSLRECAEGLVKKSDLFSPYGNKLVDQLHDFSINQDFSHIGEVIGAKEYARYTR